MANKAELRRRYLIASSRYENLVQGFDCGNALAEFINPEIRRARDELNAVIREVEAAMAKEQGAERQTDD